MGLFFNIVKRVRQVAASCCDTGNLMEVTMEVLNVPVTKLSRNIEIGFDTLPAASQYVLAFYGLKQLLNDKTAGKEEAEAQTAVMATVEKLKTGEYKLGAFGGGPRLSPLERQARVIATEAIKSALARKGKKADKATLAKLVAQLEVREDILAKAQEALDAQSELLNGLEIEV